MAIDLEINKYFGDLSTFFINNKMLQMHEKINFDDFHLHVEILKEREVKMNQMPITFLDFRIDDVVVLYCGLNVAI